MSLCFRPRVAWLPAFVRRRCFLAVSSEASDPPDIAVLRASDAMRTLRPAADPATGRTRRHHAPPDAFRSICAVLATWARTRVQHPPGVSIEALKFRWLADYRSPNIVAL